MNEIKFNINDNVKVKLTKRGLSYLEGIKKEYGYHFKEAIDEEGWMECQLWVLMETFGPHTTIGADPCFETEIKLMVRTNEKLNNHGNANQ